MTTDIDTLLNPAPDTVDTFPKKMAYFAALTAALRDGEDKVKEIKAKLESLQPHLLEEMAMNGMDRGTFGGYTLYPQTDLIVSKKSEDAGVTTDMVVEALRESGLGYMTGETYSASSLKAWVKEVREQGIDLPEKLAPLINVFEKQKLVARKA